MYSKSISDHTENRFLIVTLSKTVAITYFKMFFFFQHYIHNIFRFTFRSQIEVHANKKKKYCYFKTAKSTDMTFNNLKPMS